jgi:hypothetical protein
MIYDFHFQDAMSFFYDDIFAAENAQKAYELLKKKYGGSVNVLNIYEQENNGDNRRLIYQQDDHEPFFLPFDELSEFYGADKKAFIFDKKTKTLKTHSFAAAQRAAVYLGGVIKHCGYRFEIIEDTTMFL